VSKNPENRPKSSADDRSADDRTGGRDPYILEETFPEAGGLFASHILSSVSDRSVAIALDASALLLPYRMNSVSLNALGQVY
jgi:hypothetical protein